MKLTIEVEVAGHHAVEGIAAMVAPEVVRLVQNQLSGVEAVVVSAHESSSEDDTVVDEDPYYDYEAWFGAGQVPSVEGIAIPPHLQGWNF